MSSARNNKIPNSTEMRGRGRPRAFDPEAAVSAAESTFLRQGYSAATIDDLSNAMGINRPSLYAAFDSKEALYQRALRIYAERMSGLFAQALQERTLSKALRRLYAAALDAYISEDGEAVGCMVACTAVTEAMSNGAVKEQTKSIMDAIDDLVAARVSKAIEIGELPRSVNAKAMSRLVVGVLHTLALRTRAGTSRRVLDQIAADAVALIVPPRVGR